VLKVHFMVNEEKKSDTMAGFQVARRDIKAKTKDIRVVKRILRTLENRLK